MAARRQKVEAVRPDLRLLESRSPRREVPEDPNLLELLGRSSCWPIFCEVVRESRRGWTFRGLARLGSQEKGSALASSKQ